ncbi:MAG: hypothetical protein AAFW89_06110, partial [Bacteroidota bacterium]
LFSQQVLPAVLIIVVTLPSQPRDDNPFADGNRSPMDRSATTSTMALTTSINLLNVYGLPENP